MQRAVAQPDVVRGRDRARELAEDPHARGRSTRRLLDQLGERRRAIALEHELRRPLVEREHRAHAGVVDRGERAHARLELGPARRLGAERELQDLDQPLAARARIALPSGPAPSCAIGTSARSSRPIWLGENSAGIVWSADTPTESTASRRDQIDIDE